MSRATTVAISKFVGTISLGLLTGLTLTPPTLLLPALLASPSAPASHRTYLRLRARAQKPTRFLSSLAAAALVLAYGLSPARGRHPYLVYAAFAVGAGGVMDLWGWGGGGEEQKLDEEEEEEGWEMDGSVTGGRGGKGLNGEMVREGMVGWGRGLWWRGAVWGVGWVVATVGLWGDGV